MNKEELANEETELLEEYVDTKSDVIEKIENNFKDILLQISSLEEALNNSAETQDKLKTIYKSGKTLIESYADNIDLHKLPVEELKIFSKIFVSIIIENNFTLSNFKTLIPSSFNIGSHSVNIAIFSSLIGFNKGMEKEELNNLFLAGLLHDIGEVKIAKVIVNKKGKITKAEREILKTHPHEAVKHLVKNSISNRKILRAISHHHERLDGSGYPEGFKEYNISSWGQILAIADVFDALITQKSYRDAYSTFDALILMKKNMGKQFNLNYIDVLIKLLR